MPLLTFDTERPGAVGLGPPPSYAAAHDDEEEKDAPPRKWYHYLPTLGASSVFWYYSALHMLIDCVSRTTRRLFP